MTLLRLDMIASQRGDGLHPALRTLFEERAALMRTGIVELDQRRDEGLRQAGPNPAGRTGILQLGNVVRLDDAAAMSARQAETNKQAKGTS